MIMKLINKMIKEGKLYIIDKHNVTEFKKDLAQEAEMFVLLGYEPEEAIKKAHYNLQPKRYTINKKRKRIKPIPIGIDIHPIKVRTDEELFVDEVLLKVFLSSIFNKDEYNIIKLKLEKGTGYKTNGINNSEIAEAIGKSRQYVQYKLKEIQKKLKKYF